LGGWGCSSWMMTAPQSILQSKQVSPKTTDLSWKSPWFI
jgi:hypothetical protein